MCDVCHDFDLTKSHSSCTHWYWYVEPIKGRNLEDLSADDLSAYYWWRGFGWKVHFSEHVNTRSRVVIFQKIIETEESSEELSRINDLMDYEEDIDWCDNIQNSKRKNKKFTRKNRKFTRKNRKLTSGKQKVN